MKRTLVLLFAGVGLAFVVSMAQTKEGRSSSSERKIVTELPAPAPPVPPTPPSLEAPPPPPAPAAPEAPEWKIEKGEIPQPPTVPDVPKVAIKIKGC